MTPAPPPPTDENVEVSDVLNDPAADSEGLDPDTVDADFEQELEDLFADDLDETPPAEADEGPIVLDDQTDDDFDADDLLVLDDVVEETSDEEDEDDLLVLDDVAGDDEADDLIVLDDVVEVEPEAAEPVSDEEAAEVEALVDDLVEEGAPEEESADEDEIIDLDDLVEETAEAEAASEADDEPLMDLDALLEEEPAESDEEPLDLSEEISLEPDDMMDVALAEEAVPEVPVHEAVAIEDLDSIMDEPEAAESAPSVVAGNVFANLEAASAAADEAVDSELTGLDQLEDDDIEDVDSLLDNVEVDVSDVVDAESDLDEDMLDLDEESLDEVLTAEAMPPDAGMDVDIPVAALLEETREEGAPTLESLQNKVHQLEGRVEELERRLREEIAQMVPAEAARIIREEIAALAADFED